METQKGGEGEGQKGVEDKRGADGDEQKKRKEDNVLRDLELQKEAIEEKIERERIKLKYKNLIDKEITRHEMEIKKLKEMQAEELKRREKRKQNSINRQERGRSADENSEDKNVGAEDKNVGAEDGRVGAEDDLWDNPMETDLSESENNLINFDI
jgi:hypothetical protein